MILITTGDSATVTIAGLRAQDNSDLVLTHPQTINLLDFYDDEDIRSVAASIQAQIDSNNIEATNQSGQTIQNVDEVLVDPSNLEAVAYSGEFSDVKNVPDFQSDIDENTLELTNAVRLQGTFDASQSVMPSPVKVGYAYRVVVDGNVGGNNLDGVDNLNTRDWIVFTNKNGNNDPQDYQNWQILQRNTDDQQLTDLFTDIYTLIGQAALQGDLATFPGNTISDNVSVKQALLELEAALELKPDTGDLSDFETSSELDARDTANRDRANHSGTQTASTISNFAATVRSTVLTGLSTATSTVVTAGNSILVAIGKLQAQITNNVSAIAANTAKVSFPEAPQDGTPYSRQDASWVSAGGGGVTDHGNLSGLGDDDHTQYLNNTRGDARYFTQAQINSQQSTQDSAIALNTAKVSADGSVATHSDFTLDGASTGDTFIWNGTTVRPTTTTNAFTVFPIWAEENGGIASGQNEWSFGNGAVGADIGIVIPFECFFFASSFNCDTFGTSVSIDIIALRNGVEVPITTDTYTAQNAFVNAVNPVPLQAGDTIIFRTNTTVGTTTDARVCAWFRQIATNDFAQTRIKQIEATNVAYTSTAFADIPTITQTVTLTKPGTVTGEATYSAARSGATNSVAQFRVVIDGVNGNTFQDTLSTFNDVGSIGFFRENLPAGTYEVKVQAAVSQPVTLQIISLKATAAED